jgi:hypothetical protein
MDEAQEYDVLISDIRKDRTDHRTPFERKPTFKKWEKFTPRHTFHRIEEKTDKPDLSKVECYHCHRFGHYKSDCRKFLAEKKPFSKHTKPKAKEETSKEVQRINSLRLKV